MTKPKFSLRFYKNYQFRWIPHFIYQKLMWKDKFESPRCEREPYFRFEWLWWGIYGVWGDDHYWEQWLWVYKYYNGNYEEAKSQWGWRDVITGKSTWIDY